MVNNRLDRVDGTLTCVMEREQKPEAISEEILAKNILNQIKDIQPLIQEAMQIPSRINIKKTTPR